MATYTGSVAITGPGLAPNGNIQRTAGGELRVSETILAADANKAVAAAWDSSQVKMAYFLSDQDILLESNNASSPAQTLVLKAGVPYFWFDTDYDTFKFSTDVTVMYATNQSSPAADATLQMYVLFDPTV